MQDDLPAACMVTESPPIDKSPCASRLPKTSPPTPLPDPLDHRVRESTLVSSRLAANALRLLQLPNAHLLGYNQPCYNRHNPDLTSQTLAVCIQFHQPWKEVCL